MRSNRPVEIAAFVILAAIFVAVRCRELTDTCLWFDEIFSVHAAEHSWDSILTFVALDLIHPPLFYVLLKLWIAVAGESLSSLRALPVLFSIVSIVPFLLLLRELKINIKTQCISLVLLIINGSILKYSLEVRMYSLLMCLGGFSMWLFARFFVRGKSLAPLVIVNILLVYTHYFGWFVVLSEVVAILAFERKKFRPVMAMLGTVAAAFLPWVVAVWNAAATGAGLNQNIGWMSRPGVKSIVQLVLNLIEPFYYQTSSAEPMSIFVVSLPIFVIAITALIIYVADWKLQDVDGRKAFQLLAVFVAVPLSIAFTVSWFLPYSIWGTRHLIIVFVPVLILVAVAISHIPNSAIRTTAMTLILLFSGYALVSEIVKEQQPYVWCAWNDVATRVGDNHAAGESEPIYVFEELTAYHLWFVLRNTENANVVLVKGTGVPEDKAYFLPRGFTSVDIIDETNLTADRIAIAFRDDGFDPTKPPLIGLLHNGYEVVETVPFPAGSSSAFLVRLRKRS